MSSTLYLPFTTNNNYTKSDDTLIEADGNATLIIQDSPNEVFTQDFTSDSGFTYDSTFTEFNAGSVKQKLYVPSGVVMYTTFNLGSGAGSDIADYPSGKVGNWASNWSGRTSQANGTVILSSVPADSSYNYSIYDLSTELITNATFTIATKVKFPYEGNPPNNKQIINIKNGNGADNQMRLTIVHRTNGTIGIKLYSLDGTQLLEASSASAFSPVSEVYYEIKAVMDSTGLYVYIDNVEKYKTLTNYTDTYFFDNSSSFAFASIGGVTLSGFYGTGTHTHFVVMNTAKHSAIDWDDLDGNLYRTDKIDCPAFNYTCAGSIQNFSGFTTTDSNSPKYILDNKYWDGSAWSVSNGTYSQANTEAEVNTNINSYPTSGSIVPSIVTNNGIILMSVDNLEIEYTGQKYPISNPYIEYNESIYMSELESLIEGSTVVGSDAIKHTIIVNSVSKYWDGAAWSNSSGYAQSNTTAEINDNIGSILATRSTLKIRSYLHSDDGCTTPTINYLILTYDAALPDPTSLPRLIDINGYIYDMNGPINGQEIKARPYLKGTQNPNNGSGGGVFQKYEYELVGTTDANGFFSASIYLQPTDEYIEFKIGRQSYYTQLPDQDAVDFNTLTLTLVE